MSKKNSIVINRRGSSQFQFAELALSEGDEDERQNGAASPCGSLFEEHAALTRKELETHREHLRQKSFVRTSHHKPVASGSNEMQRTVANLMQELTMANNQLEKETARRISVEAKYSALEIEYQKASEELSATLRREALARFAAPRADTVSPLLATPTSRTDVSSTASANGQKVGFRLVKKSNTDTAAITLLTQEEHRSRRLLTELSTQLVTALYQCATLSNASLRTASRVHRRAVSHLLREQVVALETSERSAIIAHESKNIYKMLIRLRVLEAEDSLRKKLDHLHNRHHVVARSLDAEMETVAVTEKPAVVTQCRKITPPPWYPAGSTNSVEYHSPHRRSPSAGRREDTNSSRNPSVCPSSSLTSLPSPRRYVPIPSTSPLQTNKRSVTPQSQRSPASRNSGTATSPRSTSASCQPSVVRAAPHSQTLLQQQPLTTRPSTRESVKKTIDSMEALLAELQQWRTGS